MKHSSKKRRAVVTAGFATLLGAAVGPMATMAYAAEADYPNRPLKIVVPYPAGAASDAMARTLGDQLQKAFGQPVIVENRPGASGTIGNSYVARATADGYTLLYSNTSLIQQPWMMSKLQYDPLKDLAALVVVARTNNAFVVPQKYAKANTLPEFIALAKADPGKYSVGNWGIGTGAHIYSEMLNRQAGIDTLQVPFQGAGPLITNLLGGQVDAGFLDIPSLMPQIASITPLAVAGPSRLASLPDVPTFRELGFESFDAEGWHGLLLPDATPAPIVQKLSDELNRILQLPEVVAKIESFGMLPGGGTPDAFAKSMQDDSAVYEKVIKAANIRLD